MHLISKISFFQKNFLSIILALVPFSFIAGNMIININIIILILSTILIQNKRLFNIKFHLLDKLLIIFFFLIIFTSLLNDILVLNKLTWSPSYSTTIKSILFLKYLLLYLTVRYLIENELIKIKYFFITSSIASIFVCLDIFYQFIYGVDIFGYKIPPGFRKLSGPFGDELIAGGFIQRFSIFSFFVLPIFFVKNSQKFTKYLIPLLFFIFFTGIILSGNRMPLLLFLLIVSLILIFQKQAKKYFLSFLIIFPIIFIIIYNFNPKVKMNYLNFYGQISKIVLIPFNGSFKKDEAPQYLKEFSTFYETWKINKYIGGGVKSFRYYCHVRQNIKKDSKFVCNMHPHNYYLEILTETGLIGFLMVTIIFFMSLYLSFFKKYISKSKLSSNNIIIPFIFLFFIEIFPIKSTGSFFTTGNATYIFLILAILIGLVRKDNLIENKN